MGLLHARRQNLLQKVEVLKLVLFGELDVELDVEVTMVVVTEGWHTLAPNQLDGTCNSVSPITLTSNMIEEHTRSDNLARSNGHSHPPVIKMLNGEATTTKSREKVDLVAIEQVVFLALEPWVGLLLDLKHNITRHDTRDLVTLAAELDLVAVLDTLVDVDMKHLALHNGLLTAAALAAVTLTDHLTLTATVRANSLEALDHGAHLAHHALHTSTIAAGTRLDSALLTTAAIAARTDNRLLQCQFRDLPTVDVLQVDLVNVVDGPGLLGTGVPHASAEHASEGTTPAEELCEEILRTHSSTGTTFEAFLTHLIVEGSLVRVRQDFVGMGQFLEFLCGLGVVCVLVCFAANIMSVLYSK